MFSMIMPYSLLLSTDDNLVETVLFVRLCFMINDDNLVETVLFVRLCFMINDGVRLCFMINDGVRLCFMINDGVCYQALSFHRLPPLIIYLVYMSYVKHFNPVKKT
jgi:hypothetical protein